MNAHRQLVADAAIYLDLHWPTEEVGRTWWETVNTKHLDLSNACACVCGQLGAELARHEGYRVEWPGLEPGNAVVLEGEDVSGYTLFVHPLGDIEERIRVQTSPRYRRMYEAELELVDKLRKRLGAGEDQDRVIPEDLLGAFSMATPTAWWVEEILARRGEAGCS